MFVVLLSDCVHTLSMHCVMQQVCDLLDKEECSRVGLHQPHLSGKKSGSQRLVRRVCCISSYCSPELADASEKTVLIVVMVSAACLRASLNLLSSG